ncbi:MAG: radical SAM protein [Candidatus Gastranaerophilales bacterium]|nr:radical SAM protein [Candidatus Gastranaerophilales bacterium]
MSEVYLYSTNKTKETQLNVWCAFPAVYNFGMSALGFLAVAKYIDNIDGVRTERIFTDTEKTYIRKEDVDVITFSFSFEMDYLGILNILKKNNIPFLAKDRDETYPLICAGGPVVTANPEPFAELFDFITIGDAEPNTQQIYECLISNKEKSKIEKLKALSEIEGVYVPALKDENYKAKKVTACIDTCVSTPILTEQSFFSNTFIIEVERGCPQNCAFCLTSVLNTPVRFCPYEEVIEQIELGLKYTNKLALLGALICSHPRIDDICQYIIDKVDAGMPLEVTVSSLRADYVSDTVLEMLHKCGQKTATIAIEAGSDRLRKVINKHLTKEDIFSIVDKMVKHGFTGLKMYGILGLPTETYEDLDAFVDLCNEIKQKYKGFVLTPSFSTFVQKAHTPFQFAKREDTKSLEKKNEYIKKEFAKIGIKARTGSVKWDYIQALISRGDRKLLPYLIEVFNQGANLGAFKSVYKDFEEHGLLKNSDEYALNEYNLDETLAWDFIEFPRKKEFLQKEYTRLMNLNA